MPKILEWKKITCMPREIANMKAIIKVKNEALARLIISMIEEQFGHVESSIDLREHDEGKYVISMAYKDENTDRITWFAAGIEAAVGNLFVA